MSILLVNFGGPRSLDEIPSFLKALLTDRDVIDSKLPHFLHHLLFSRIAKKRAVSVRADYAKIGGRSPIFDDTETLADLLRTSTQQPVFTFHRYLPSAHAASIAAIEASEGPIKVFPLFPQFSYATTGSIARWFSRHLSSPTLLRMEWIASYAGHPAFIAAWQNTIREMLHAHHLAEEKVVLLFSAHGLPRESSLNGDIYERECQLSFQKIAAGFPRAISRLSYQSKFGKGEWLSPYTNEVCETILSWNQGRQKIVVIPLSFTSDHIETLFEIEELYLSVIREKGLEAFRSPALNHRPDWLAAIIDILDQTGTFSTPMLIKH